MTPSKPLFVDTSFLIALLNSHDQYHLAAQKIQQTLSLSLSPKVTSEYVLMELGDGLSRLRFRALARQVIALIQQDPTFQIIPSSSELFGKGWQLFAQRPDKEWGLTDCTSFVIMQELGLTVALTADQHFRQVGFQAMLLE